MGPNTSESLEKLAKTSKSLAKISVKTSSVAQYMASIQKGLVWEGDLLDGFDFWGQDLKFWFTLASMGTFAILR